MAKKEVFGIELEHYLGASKGKKGEILDTLVRQTKMHRGSIIRRFKREQYRLPGDFQKVGRKEYYGADVTLALREVWEASGELCGELVHPIIGDYIDIFISENTWEHGDITTAKLRAISEATVKRRVSNFMKARSGKSKSTTNPSLMKEKIPVFCGPWLDVDPGHGQIDTVVHCGATLAGMMVFTMSYTDVATGWWRGRSQWGKGMEVTRNSLSYVKETLEIPWFHAHPDCGTEFLNQFVIKWAKDNDMDFTRSRSYHKNDNAYVEQKNGHVVRKEIGYRRLDTTEVITVMNELYEKLSLHRNFFVPQRKLLSKERNGAKYRKKYDKAKTPYERVLSADSVSPKVKESLTQFRAKLNPQKLRQEINSLKSKLFKIQEIHGSDVR